ncbi:MAG TPA: NAD-dependent epimerase/dehydratase family protein [Chloroflexi bacterium]|nr:NAD-dependent epimerase/dehydratase family protein [Chloroflexota bacterium]
MRKKVILVTGASGEIGQALITHLAERGNNNILAIDIRPVPEPLRSMCQISIVGDILDTALFERLVSEYAIQSIYHLAALLSTRAEFTPEAAHRINVEGTLNLLHLAIEQSRWQGRSVKFLFPSSVAVYGLPDLETKTKVSKIKENQFTKPSTMYGCNKLYCENLGRYYARHYRQLATDPEPYGVDFRSIRFPGLISAATLPSGGTSDYAPEMLHHAAQGKAYAAFVRPDTRIPFAAMPDAVKAVLQLAAAPRKNLKHLVYNIGSFSLSAAEIKERMLRYYPNAQISFTPDDNRQGIVDSWPADVDDTFARQDWGWQPDYDAARAFDEYLIPTISERYAN